VFRLKKITGMSGSEAEIMKAIWEKGAPVTAARLLQVFESRGWKAQTMATFLSRLADKGLLTITKQAKANLYSPAMNEREYRGLEARNLLSSYGGSLRNFVSALYGGEGIDPEEAAELKKWFEESGGGAGEDGKGGKNDV
jgi:predicted transcriptional regulator